MKKVKSILIVCILLVAMSARSITANALTLNIYISYTGPWEYQVWGSNMSTGEEKVLYTLNDSQQLLLEGWDCYSIWVPDVGLSMSIWDSADGKIYLDLFLKNCGIVYPEPEPTPAPEPTTEPTADPTPLPEPTTDPTQAPKPAPIPTPQPTPAPTQTSDTPKTGDDGNLGLQLLSFTAAGGTLWLLIRYRLSNGKHKARHY